MWCVSRPEWTCRVDEGAAGLAHVRWAPCSRHVLTISELGVRATVWSLGDRARCAIGAPKHWDGRGVSFGGERAVPADSADAAAVAATPNSGAWMAVLERAGCKDYVAVYDASTFALAARFPTTTADAADLAWSPDGTAIAVWDSPLEHRVMLHAPDGAPLGEYSAYSGALGIKSVCWAPGGQLLAVGSYDEKLRVLNHLTWQPLAECAHPTTVRSPEGAVVYKELVERPELAPEEAAERARDPTAAAAAAARRGRYVVCALPESVPVARPPAGKANPRLGVGRLAWSPDGAYLATVNDNMAGTVWVWDMRALSLAAVLLHAEPIAAARWDPEPTTARLAIATGEGRVGLWTPEGVSCVHVPLPGFKCTDLQWNPCPPGGQPSFVLTDRGSLTVAFME